MENCPCGNELEYSKCCEVYHNGDKTPETAEQLMRSRYSAFAKNKVQYIADTHLPGTDDFNIDEAREWATNSVWKGLQIVSTKKGQKGDANGVVEFKALYADKDDKDYLHHEVSTFKNIDGKWHYEDGQLVGTGPLRRETPKVGRNEPCPCGSGKKFKKCCGAA